MFVQLFIFFISSLVFMVRTQDACNGWKNQKNVHLVHSEGDCGKVKINQETSSRILNGKAVEHGSLPWMAHIRIRAGHDLFRCGGSVINENYILTAAHCLEDSPNPVSTVYLGLHDQDMLDDGVAEKYNVTQHIIHPAYNNTTYRNDIALLRLDRSINLTSPYINYICLPTTCELARQSFVGESLTLAGWGDIADDITASTLKKVVIKGKRCKTVAISASIMYSPDWTHICAGSGNKMICDGDSGGPLMYEADGRFVQVGVSSLGLMNCTKTSNVNVRSYFSRVAAFVGWILKTVKP